MLTVIGLAWLALAVIIVVMIERSPLECRECGGYSPPRDWPSQAWKCPLCAEHRKNNPAWRP